MPTTQTDGRKAGWRDPSFLVRTTALTAGLALALVGCGTLMPGGNTGTGTTSIATAVDNADGPGVSEESVKVVFIGTDLSEVQETTGMTTESLGDLEKQVETLEKWVNDNGGLGGRKMEAKFRWYNAITDSPEAEEKLCNQVTQDDKAFAVVLTGQFQANARPCYAAGKTLMLDAALLAADQEFYDELAPYLWTASFPEFGVFTEKLIEELDNDGFFEGQTKVGIVAGDSPVNKRVVENLAVPMVEALGLEPSVSWIETTSMGTLGPDLDEAAKNFQGREIETVFFLGGARMASLFGASSGRIGYSPRLAISSYDNPTYFVNNRMMLVDTVLDGSVGIGFHPPQEVTDADKFAFPSKEEKVCTDIYDAANIKFATREGARVGLPFCDAARMLKLGADNLDGAFNATNWSKAVSATGGDFVPSSGFGSGLGESNAAAGGYYVLRYDKAENAFAYEGEEKSFYE